MLKKQEVGFLWRKHFVGAVCYADDIALLAPSASVLRLMLNKCTEYADQHHLTAKTQLIRFSYPNPISHDSLEFFFLGQSVVFSSKVVHLGHILSCDLSYLY